MIPNPAAAPAMMEGRMMHRIVDEIFSRVSGFFNENNGTFTIGEEGFVTKMCKELKEKYHIDPKHPKAEMFDRMVEGACGRIMEKMKQKHQAESDHARMLELSGMMPNQGVKEQRSDYNKDEIVAMLTGRKTQAEVDAEALRTRGPDKEPTATPATRPTSPTTKPVQGQGNVREGDELGRVLKIAGLR
jgi:hypothetical protein